MSQTKLQDLSPISRAKRIAVIDAAEMILKRDGFARARMVEIANAAEVSTATLYKHFSSKEALFAEVVRHVYGEVNDGLGAILAGYPTPQNIEETKAVLALGVERQLGDESIELAHLVIAETGAAPEVAQEYYERSTTQRFREIKTILDRMVADGILAPHDTLRGAKFMMGILREFLTWPKLFTGEAPGDVDVEWLVDETIEMYFARYGAETGSIRAASPDDEDAGDGEPNGGYNRQTPGEDGSSARLPR